MDRIGEIARDNGLLVIEDAAHAIEAEFHGRKIGTIGAMTCFSFYVTKNLYTGEGGMVTTGDERLASTIKTYGLHGMTKDAWRRYSDEGYRHYEVTFPGFKYNMMDMQAALGLAQLPYLAERLQRRTEIWRAYDEAFAGLPLRLPPCEEPGTVHARHLYTLQLDLDRVRGGRDELMQALQKENIGTGVHYRSLHLQPYYRERFGFRPGDFPRAAAVSERVLSIPLSAKLTDDDVGDVIAAVTRCVEAMAV
jgi:dTDP-4-amino-4,6-dideoxygalactose transaminase